MKMRLDVLALLVVMSMALVSCAAPEVPPVRVMALTGAPDAKYTWGSDRSLYLNDVDGRNYRIALDKVDAGSKQFKLLHTCMDDLRHGSFLRMGEIRDGSPDPLIPQVRRCFTSSGLALPLEDVMPDATHYKVRIQVDNIPGHLTQPEGIPISRTGNGILSSTLDVSSPSPILKVVLQDVSECKKEAGRDGVTDSTSSTTGSVSYSHVSIKAMVIRFKDCLEQRHYGVSLSSS